MQNSSPDARGRGRPRAFDRETALAKATHLFWRKGYEATSISDLTAVIGIGSPSLYAAFGSKEALYVEALRHYQDTYEGAVWSGFKIATTARAAVEALLMDSANALTGALPGAPNGCMVTLSSIAEHPGLADMVRMARGVTLERLEARLTRAMTDGEISAGVDLHALARFVQTIQNGMSILARDGADRAELEAVAQVAMTAWDARVA